MLLYQNLALPIHGKIEWNEEFELPNGSYSVSDIQVYFEYIFKKHETVLVVLQ